MPELPEVETVRRGLEQQVGRFCVEQVEVLRSRAVAAPRGDGAAFAAALVGCALGQWRRRGKYLICGLERNGSAAGELGAHLRMTGQFQWLAAAERPACAHTRVRFHGVDPEGTGRELRFVDLRSFGELWWVPPGCPTETVITGL